jgi:hypothetical protein
MATRLLVALAVMVLAGCSGSQFTVPPDPIPSLAAPFQAQLSEYLDPEWLGPPNEATAGCLADLGGDYKACGLGGSINRRGDGRPRRRDRGRVGGGRRRSGRCWAGRRAGARRKDDPEEAGRGTALRVHRSPLVLRVEPPMRPWAGRPCCARVEGLDGPLPAACTYGSMIVVR